MEGFGRSPGLPNGPRAINLRSDSASKGRQSVHVSDELRNVEDPVKDGQRQAPEDDGGDKHGPIVRKMGVWLQ